MNDLFVTVFDIRQGGLTSALGDTAFAVIFVLIAFLLLPLLLFLLKKKFTVEGFFLRYIPKEMKTSLIKRRTILYWICFIGSLGMAALAFPFCLIITISTFVNYESLIGAIDKGQSKVVVGRIEHFQPYDTTNRTEGYMDEAKEEFDVSGVHFAYSPNVVGAEWHKVRGDGSPLDNGRVVRLTYVEKRDGNHIVKVEMLEK